MAATPPYKYQKLIDSLSLNIDCPDGNCKNVSMTAYRLVRESFADGQSFLPNIPYDENRKRPRRMNDKTDQIKCGLCGLSFSDNENTLRSMVKAMGGPTRVAELLQYTHIAQGVLKPGDGVATDPPKGHFVFFEYAGVTLESQFKVISPL